MRLMLTRRYGYVQEVAGAQYLINGLGDSPKSSRELVSGLGCVNRASGIGTCLSSGAR